MKQFFLSLLFLALISAEAVENDERYFSGSDPAVQYIGRREINPAGLSRLWASGAYVKINFRGKKFKAIINDENRYGSVLNYLEVKIDDQPAYRIKLTGKSNELVLANGLTAGKHSIVICKNTEGENGYIEFVGFRCEALLPPEALQQRKMEFIGDSITCGFGADESGLACGDKNSQWYDQHNAWMAYGPVTARQLNAQWHLSSVSGIGLIHSCCDKKILMPEVYDKINMSANKLPWDFSKYQPDVVTVCLGQNDGIQDSVKFCSAYVNFVGRLRYYYPKAKFILLSSPMADRQLKPVMVKYITAVKNALRQNGDTNIGSYFFSKQSRKGCGSHPSLSEQQEIADELITYLKKEMKW